MLVRMVAVANTPKSSILGTVAPNLPMPGPNHDKVYLELLTNAQRLYYNQIDRFTQSLLNVNGASALSFPNIAASHNANQYAGGNNTATIVAWDTLEVGSGFTLNANNTATANFTGIYKIDYSIEMANTDNAVHDAVFWLKQTRAGVTTNVARSASKFSLPARKSNGTPSYIVAYSSVVFELQAGDSIGLWWETDLAYKVSPLTNGVYIHYEAAAGDYPAIPSAIGSIVFVSRPTA